MPDDARYTEDAYYKKGNFHILFDIAPKKGEEKDDKAVKRAVKQLLVAMRDEVGLKVSSFADIYEPAPVDEFTEDDTEPPQDTVEFVVFNKLGVTSLSKLRRFMGEHLQEGLYPKMVLIDPKTQQRYDARNFTIQYLFREFVAGAPKDNWDDLKEYLKAEDKGYAELTRTASTRTVMTLHDLADLAVDWLESRNRFFAVWPKLSAMAQENEAQEALESILDDPSIPVTTLVA